MPSLVLLKNMMQFIKPTISKIIIFVVLLALSMLIPWASILGQGVLDGPILNYTAIECGRSFCARGTDLPYTIFNVIFYYLVSCLIPWAVSNFKWK